MRPARNEQREIPLKRRILSNLEFSVKLWLLVVLVPIWFAPGIAAQRSAPPTRVVELPETHISRIQSPDRRWTLVFEFTDYASERRLWIEDAQSHGRRLVQASNRSVTLSWSPDSRLFFLNDEYVSNATDCYVIEPSTLERTDVADLLAKGYPALLADHRKAGHLYFEARRWVAPSVLSVAMAGHFDEPPAQAFTYLFRIDLNGGVRKVGESRKEEHR